jgi:hypothetical protein
MRNDLSGKNILIIEGPRTAIAELRQALRRQGARPIVARNTCGAIALLDRLGIDGAIVAHGNEEVFELCGEFQEHMIPYVFDSAHRLPGFARKDAEFTVWRLARCMVPAEKPTVDVPLEHSPGEACAEETSRVIGDSHTQGARRLQKAAPPRFFQF